MNFVAVAQKPEPIVEIVVFRARPGMADRAKELTRKAVEEARQKGDLLDDVLYQSPEDENLFVHQVSFRSLADAKRAGTLFPTFAASPELSDLMENALVMAHVMRVDQSPAEAPVRWFIRLGDEVLEPARRA